jgi:hypothetical protein
VTCYKRSSLDSLFSMDRPSVIDLNAHSRSAASIDTKQIEEMQSRWTHHIGMADISKHLCFVAAGMAPRPRRPDQPVTFRPFSSRDAHVLLQLKRTMEVANGPTIQTVFRYALQVGKGVRNPVRVPELNLLRPFGTDNSKFTSQPPMKLVQQVQEAAIRRVVDPTLEQIMNDELINVSTLSGFRQQAESLASNAQELRMIKKQIHDPTVRLRQGQVVDTKSVLNQLELDLVKQRCGA